MNTQIYEEAAKWLIEFRTGDNNTVTRKQFDTWIRKSPEHLRAYLELTEIWQDASFISESPEHTLDHLIAAARAEENIVDLTSHSAGPFSPITRREVVAHAVPEGSLESESPQRSGFPDQASASPSNLDRRGMRSIGQQRVRFLAAASLLIAIGTAGWLYAQHGLYTTDIGEQRTLRLADGSTVKLNSRSKVRIRYTDQARNVELLDGQALFHVAKDTARPFIVRSDTAQVRAVGTQFDVYRKTTGTIVTVLEGTVAVGNLIRPKEPHPPASQTPSSAVPGEEYASAAGDLEEGTFRSSGSDNPSPRERRGGARGVGGEAHSEILLTAGQQLAVTLTDVTQPKLADVETATAWTQQRLVFKSSPLTSVAEEFNRYNPRRIIVADATLADFLISGVYSSTNPALFIHFLREQPGIAVNESGDDIVITRL